MGASAAGAVKQRPQQRRLPLNLRLHPRQLLGGDFAEEFMVKTEGRELVRHLLPGPDFRGELNEGVRSVSVGLGKLAL